MKYFVATKENPSLELQLFRRLSAPQWTSWICLLNTVFSSPTGNQEEHDQKWVRNYNYIVLVC